MIRSFVLAGLLVALLVCLTTVATAQDAMRAVASVPADRVLLGGSTVLDIVVSGTHEAQPPSESQFGDDLDATFAGGVSETSSSTRAGVRRVLRTYTMRFLITPKRAGRITVPALVVKVGERQLVTEPVVLIVDGPRPSEHVAVELTSSRSRVWVEEPLALELKVRVRQLRFEGEWLDADPAYPDERLALRIPWFDELEDFAGPDPARWRKSLLAPYDSGFSINDIGTREFFGGVRTTVFALPRTRVLRDGHQWLEYTLRKELVPLRAGTYEIAPSSVRGKVATSVRQAARGLRRADPVTVFVAHEPVTVEVLPVPAEGRPPTYSHAVGRFDVAVSVDPVRAKVGDPLTLTVWIQGNGLLDNVRPPRLAEQVSLTDDFAVGDPVGPPEWEGGRKGYTFTIRPRRADVTEVPPIELSFFDPGTEKFETVRSRVVAVEVDASDAVGSGDVLLGPGAEIDRARSPGEEQSGGLLANYAVEELLYDETYEPRRSVAVHVLLVLPPFAYGLLALVAWRRRKRRADPQRRRVVRALSTALAALGAGDLDADRLHRVLAGYVEDRTRRPPGGMTASEVRELFAERGIGGAAAEGVVSTLEVCEQARYGGGPADLGVATGNAAAWLRALDKEGLA